MATLNREAIDSFISITGLPEPIALQRLNAYGGNLNEAINAHFTEGDRDRNPAQEAPATMSAPLSDLMDIDDPSSLLSATTGLNSFSVLDPTFKRDLFDNRNLFDRSSDLTGQAPVVFQPREARKVSVEVMDGPDNVAGHSENAHRIENVTDTLQRQRPHTRTTVVLSDEDDDSSTGNIGGNQIPSGDNGFSAPRFGVTTVYENDIEKEMIRAAIKASKRDSEFQNTQDLHDVGPVEMPFKHEGADLDHVVALSMKTTEQEKLQREHSPKPGASGSSSDKFAKKEKLGRIDKSTGRRQGAGASVKPSSKHKNKKEAGSSSRQERVKDLDDLPLRRKSRHRSSGYEKNHIELGEAEVGPVLSPSRSTDVSQTQPNRSVFHAHEWGGLSSEEHDEAVMLEAAMFGGIPENAYGVPYEQQLTHSGFDVERSPRPLSPSLVAQRSIREQQDDEYHAALQADREKMLRAEEEEKTAKLAALQEEKEKEEESQRKLEAEQELERQLAAKEASLPKEPSLDDQNIVTLLVRMPDGSRRGRRFYRTDKLQSLFNFIDIGRGVKPGTYRLVRPYPRQAFGAEESNVTLIELGLTSKQEALFLELASKDT